MPDAGVRGRRKVSVVGGGLTEGVAGEIREIRGLIHILSEVCDCGVELVKIYECLCDVTRLRLLNVLARGPVCVCHFQEVLGEPQVKISKHLAYLRERGLVECERQGNWVIYALATKPSRELKANLACLQDCARENAVLRRDLARLKKIEPACAWVRAGEPENAPRQCRCAEARG